MTFDVLEAHIAILVCDTPIYGITEKFGDFGDNANTLLSETFGCKMPFVKYQLKDDDEIRLGAVYSRLIDGFKSGLIRGVFLTGSRSDSFAMGVKWIERLDKFISEVLFQKDNFPIVGICFGHQILAKNLGSKVGRNTGSGSGWELGTTTIDLNPDIFGKSGNYFDFLKTKDINNSHLNIIEFHQDIVHSLPFPGPLTRDTQFLSIGSTAKCNIQGLITDKGPLKILTFQGHPEFTTEMSLEMLKDAYRNNTIDKTSFETGIYNTTNLNNQGKDIGKVICKFLFT